MKKGVLLVGLVVALVQLSFGQKDTTYWQMKGSGTVNISQASFHNWAAGGENTIALTGILTGSANYNKGKSAWSNALRLSYGVLRTGSNEAATMRKSEDIIELNSKYNLKIKDNFSYAAFLNARTQFDYGYNFPDDSTVVSKFLAPLVMDFGIGFDYKKADWLTVLVAPITGKYTLVGDTNLVDQTVYGVDAGMKGRMELGASIVTGFKKDIVKNVTLDTRLKLFSNYLENPQNIDVQWDVLLAMQVNKYMSASITTQLLYDEDILIPIEDANGNMTEGTGIQFKEVIAIGLSYKF